MRRARLAAWLADELARDRLARSLVAGSLIFLLELVVVVSFTALILGGPLAAYLPAALGLTLVGDAVLCAVVALTSSYGGSVALQQDAPAAILAVMVTAVLSALPAAVSAETRFATALALVLVTTLASGVCLVLLGWFRLGGLVRFLPHPVVAGFLAGTGWLLITGALGMATDQALTWEVWQPAQLQRWLPALAFGLIVLGASGRWKHPLTLPICLLAGVGVFYGVSALSGASVESLRAQGWLLGEFPARSLWQFPFTSAFLAQVDWAALLGQLTGLGPILLISVVALLLNGSGLELVTQRDLDLNRELVAAGLGNLAAGLTGGLPGYHTVSLSALNHRVAAGRRLPALLAAGLLLLVVAAGAGFMAYLPRPLLAGVVFYVGLALLYEWTLLARRRLPLVDFLIILVILAVIALRGFLEGVGVGLALAVALFVVNYSRTRVVQHTLSGATFHSRFSREPAQRAALQRRGEELYILQLQGFIFFGTAHSLYEQVRQRASAKAPPARFVILDFARVTGLDSTGLLSFEKLLALADQQALTLVLTGLGVGLQRMSLREQLARGGIVEKPGRLRFFDDLDRGVGWCEDQLLAEAALPPGEAGLAEHFARWLPSEQLARLLSHMEPRLFAAGDYLMRQGDPADDIFLIEIGQVTSQLEKPGEQPVRLETMRGGRIVGEIGFYLGTPRSAAVKADEPTRAFRLTRQALAAMEQTDPESASAFHRLIAQLLSARALHLIQSVEALQR